MDAATRRLLLDFINLPTAPFAEAAPIRFIRAFVSARPALVLKSDPFGNLYVRYRAGRTRIARPILLAGHLDHPGFIADRMVDSRTLRAIWRGGVRAEFFKAARVRFWSGGRDRVVGTVVDIEPERGATPQRVSKGNAKRKPPTASPAPSTPAAALIRVREAIAPGSVGMWDLPEARIKGDQLMSRACDDVAAVAAILVALDRLCRSRAAGEVHALFTRAEEVGFGGALAACAAGSVSRRCVIAAVECSSVIAGVALGAGPVLRVGDKATVFTPAATAFCQAVADDHARSQRGFAYQRKLMDGGTCESTVYCHYGYDATGICLPLMNYHNMDRQRGVIAPEMVSIRDWERLVDWFVAMATTPRRYDGSHPGLEQRLRALHRRHQPLLLRTAADLHHARRL